MSGAGRSAERLSDGERVYCLDGDPLRHLDVRFRAGMLSVDDGRSIRKVGGLSDVSIEVREVGGRPALVVDVRFEGGEDATIRSSYGAWPLLRTSAR